MTRACCGAIDQHTGLSSAPARRPQVQKRPEPTSFECTVGGSAHQPALGVRSSIRSSVVKIGCSEPARTSLGRILRAKHPPAVGVDGSGSSSTGAEFRICPLFFSQGVFRACDMAAEQPRKFKPNSPLVICRRFHQNHSFSSRFRLFVFSLPAQLPGELAACRVTPDPRRALTGDWAP